MQLIKLNISAFFLIVLSSCIGNSSQSSVNITSSVDDFETQEISKIEETEDVSVVLFENNYQKLKLSKGINTKQNEYYPVPNSDGSILYFVGMDRTGQFTAKIDFTVTKNYGGEDIWFSIRENGIYTDAKPLKSLNDNNHQAVTGILNNDLLVYGIYEEAYKVDGSGTDAGFYNGDIFKININTNKLEHLGQPINSIFFESDAYITPDGNTILFVTDHNPVLGSYHQKGWNYNNSFWGNTDIWVSEKVDDYWNEPINLGEVINTEFGERTPYLSSDKKKIYFSSNGHIGYGEQDVFVSDRLDLNTWTSWSKPKNLGEGINGEYNDWGFKVYDNETKAMLASETKLPYKVDARLLGGGNGAIREHNLRNGYKVEGKQSASFNYDCRTDIYYVDMINKLPVITIEDMLFDFNKYTIKSSNNNILDRLTEVINDNKKYKIQIVGHTDNVGGKEYNQNLSEKRAETIFNALIQAGVSADRMSFSGEGEEKSIVENTTDVNRKKNRRVEIIFKNN
ncbi:OmpA family protein [Flavobacteriales bacterium]|nr:OmpA family protein [Flavobacteriales bacterium]